MLDNYPRLAIFIGVFGTIIQCIYSLEMGVWLIAQFGFPVTSTFLLFIIGFVFLGLLFKWGIELITLLIGTIEVLGS